MFWNLAKKPNITEPLIHGDHYQSAKITDNIIAGYKVK